MAASLVSVADEAICIGMRPIPGLDAESRKRRQSVAGCDGETVEPAVVGTGSSGQEDTPNRRPVSLGDQSTDEAMPLLVGPTANQQLDSLISSDAMTSSGGARRETVNSNCYSNDVLSSSPASVGNSDAGRGLGWVRGQARGRAGSSQRYTAVTAAAAADGAGGDGVGGQRCRCAAANIRFKRFKRYSKLRYSSPNHRCLGMRVEHHSQQVSLFLFHARTLLIPVVAKRTPPLNGNSSTSI